MLQVLKAAELTGFKSCQRLLEADEHCSGLDEDNFAQLLRIVLMIKFKERTNGWDKITHEEIHQVRDVHS